jgi:hypothetical protein
VTIDWQGVDVAELGAAFDLVRADHDAQLEKSFNDDLTFQQRLNQVAEARLAHMRALSLSLCHTLCFADGIAVKGSVVLTCAGLCDKEVQKRRRVGEHGVCMAHARAKHYANKRALVLVYR